MKLKTLSLVALAASALFAAPAMAQASAGDTNRFCSFADITNATVSACSGFWSGNLLNTGNPGPTDADETLGLNTLLGQSASSYAVIEKIADTAAAPANFTPMLYGMTVIGIHFGQSPFNPGYDGQGGGTAFYKFDAGTAGLDTVVFAANLARSSSGATLYMTGDGPVMNPVPEPSTYALMLGGLAALGFVARRRSRK
jgi:hypothetical protein